jgi:nitroimidazol reductase NimA-like FMN-containing flavoprotein (pyridoxamine 5'-phosphate oxidase superfamily)
MPATMTREEIYEWLDGRRGWIIISTIGRDGYPHSVPLGYFRMGDDFYVGARENGQRYKNILRNPRVALMAESGSSRQDIKGVIIQGDAEAIRDRPTVLALMRDSLRRRGTPEDQLPAEPPPGLVYIRVRPRRFISWDYSR